MDDLVGAGADVSPDDDDFTVAQNTEFDEPDEAHDDDERSLDDSLADDEPGLDTERHVDLRDESIAASDD